jgi:hypothetical protein
VGQKERNFFNNNQELSLSFIFERIYIPAAVPIVKKI